MTQNDQRLYELTAWVKLQIQKLVPELSVLVKDAQLISVSGDASFRRYYRCTVGNYSWVCVDAPPEKEDSSAFVRVAELLSRHQILVPKVHAFDLQAGFMLLADFGNALMLDSLCAQSSQGGYDSALALLFNMQSIAITELQSLPSYDAHSLQQEMDLFESWFLPEYLQFSPDADQVSMLKNTYSDLIQSALSQPKVFVHRDYHSRNLMWVDSTHMGVIDFQDAVCGPITYDLVSLLRDCYICWPEEQVRQWLMAYAERLKAAGMLDPQVNHAQWQQWFDWMGLQRHIKVCGIFSRLCYRDGKAGYIKDIPLTIRYLLRVACRYERMQPFGEFLQTHVLPKLYQLNPQAQAVVEA